MQRQHYNGFVRKIAWKGVDWIHPAEDSDKWRDLVNMVDHEPSGK
jgi:hypothetical protein